MKEEKQIQELFIKYLDGHCNEEEKSFLLDFLSLSENEDMTKLLILSELERDDNSPTDRSLQIREILDGILKKIEKGKADTDQP